MHRKKNRREKRREETRRRRRMEEVVRINEQLNRFDCILAQTTVMKIIVKK
jgi:hypothetical protein